MELKVWVEGIQRIVCGVTENTTCQDVVFALAHATGKSGRFTLIERWRNNERLLAPNENPLKILLKWGEYSNDVQFILQWSESNKQSQPAPLKTKTPSTLSSPSTSSISIDPPDRHKPQKVSPVSSGSNNCDIVSKNLSHVKSASLEVKENLHSPKKSSQCGSDISDSPSQYKRDAPPYKDPPAPPPYRDPPPPNAALEAKYKKSLLQDFNKPLNKNQETVLYNTQYRELINLVNYQREKLSTQHADLTKYDAEIVFWEGKSREQQYQMDFIAQELKSVGNISKINQEQVFPNIQAMNYVEEEYEIVKQQEKTLKSEITLLRSKLANCETELLQCKNKIRLVMDELQLEQRAQIRRNESQRSLERNLLVEVERLQREIEIAKQSTELHHLTAETLKREVAGLELAIIEKKKQVENLVTEMKEANLQSLSIAPADEVKHLLEGPTKAGSTRKMIGSPRQLENAVPTNKNPHGVWV